MEDEEERIHIVLVGLMGEYLEIAKEESCMFDNIDSFVALIERTHALERWNCIHLIAIRGTMRFGIKWVKWWEISWSSIRST
jgi:hypothetical protein